MDHDDLDTDHAARVGLDPDMLTGTAALLAENKLLVVRRLAPLER